MIKTMFLVLIAATAGLTNSAPEPQDPGPHGGVSTITGCVTSDDRGSYKLTYSKAKHGDVTLTGNENLKDKVGHEVKVTGKWEKESTAGSKTDTKTFKVEKIQMLSDSCSLPPTPQ